MSRDITINYARFTDTPRTSYDSDAGSGTISVPYVVGARTTTQGVSGVDAQGNPVNGPVNYYQDHPTCTKYGVASVPLSPTDTAVERLQALEAAVAAQEGLVLSAGDEILTR